MPMPLIIRWYIMDMSPALALFMFMNGMPVPIVAVVPVATWPLLKLLFGVLDVCRCWSRWLRSCAVFTSI